MTIRPMTAAEFDAFYRWSRENHARALYEKCGYQILRPFSYGNFIVKEL